MKGVTFVIILSVVWSIVSGIIEKRKAAAKKEAAQGNLSTQSAHPQLQQSPVNVKVQSLRRRKQPVSPPVQVARPKHEIHPIAPLHKEECPLPPQESRQSAPKPAGQIVELLNNRRNIRTAIVLSEILGKPVSQR